MCQEEGGGGLGVSKTNCGRESDANQTEIEDCESLYLLEEYYCTFDFTKCEKSKVESNFCIFAGGRVAKKGEVGGGSEATFEGFFTPPPPPPGKIAASGRLRLHSPDSYPIPIV